MRRRRRRFGRFGKSRGLGRRRRSFRGGGRTRLMRIGFRM